MARPDTNQMLAEVWGWGDESSSDDYVLPLISLASNILVGTNPPYSANDFYATFPNFAGTPVTPQGTLDGTTAVVTGISSMASLAMGQLVAGTGIPNNSVITALDQTNKTITLSQNTTQAGLVTLTVYVAPAVPMSVLNAYIYLASNSILQVRYCEMWSFAMALYIAHYLTLWMQSQSAPPGSTPQQIAAAGLAMGVRISKSVGDVSTSSRPLEGFDDWGTYALTLYGQQLITFAMAVGSGPVLLW